MKHIIRQVVNEVQKVLLQVDEEEIIRLAKKIMTAERVFISGTGRSGLIGKVFAMRLMHSGYNVYVTGETITPSIDKNDLLIVVSGSGTTRSLVNFAESAKSIGAHIVLVTTNKESVIGKMSEQVVVIPAATKRRLQHEPKTIQPLGSQFDQSVHLLLDALIVYLLQNQEVIQTHKDLSQRHSNLE